MRSVVIGAGIAILLAGGLVHGYRTNRWGPSREVEDAARRLDRLPATLGDWEGTDMPIDAREREMAGGAGSVLRRFSNKRTGEVMTVFLICGRPGPVAVHTPEVCYPSSGFHMLGDTTTRTVEQDAPLAAAEFQVARVREARAQGTGDEQRVYWSWSIGDTWQTPRSPRLAFARYPVLYKLYVIHTLAGDGDEAETATEAEFIRLLLPEVQKCFDHD